MMKRRYFLGGVTAAMTARPASALWSKAGELKVEQVLGGLDEPWGLAFLPGGGFVVTERVGRLTLVQNGTAQNVAGVPEVYLEEQGGLLDVMVPRDFAQSREIFMSFAKAQGDGARTALCVGRLTEDGDRLADLRVVFEAASGARGGRHFGSRIAEALDGRIFLTIGDRGDGSNAQDLTNHNGAVIRINRDGTVPSDNPFVGTPGAQPEIWSYGHRNPQGATLDEEGNLWTVEHGAQGGDEINRIVPGANYGWPIISYGREYSGEKIGEGTAKPGMEQPAFYWDPSIAPSGMVIHSGRMFPEWRGNVFVGSLNMDHICRVGGSPMGEIERIYGEELQRVRDVREGPDGALWFLSVRQGAVYRLTPA
jgi:glucose/arabinose dehydrogenase